MTRRKTALTLAIASLVMLGTSAVAQGLDEDAGDAPPAAGMDTQPPERNMGMPPSGEGGMGAPGSERGMGMPPPEGGMGAPPSGRGTDMPRDDGMNVPPREGLDTPGPNDRPGAPPARP